MEIGPRLPPHLACRASYTETNDDEHEERNESDNADKIGPTMARNKKLENVQDKGMFGPALPPGFKTTRAALIGPCRPKSRTTDHLETDMQMSYGSQEDDEEEEEEVQEDEGVTIGPRLPTHNDEDEYLNRRREEIESRAKVKKDELVDKKNRKPKKTEREEWMTELPPELGKNFGLGPRKFRSRDVDLGDRSVWTDTPSDRMKKQNKSDLKTTEQRKKSKRELETEEYVNEHNKHFRDQSLLDMHQHDRKKKKKEEGNSEKERRPFDRDIDLGVRQLDAAKRKALIKQSSNLNSKFEHSQQGPTYL